MAPHRRQQRAWSTPARLLVLAAALAGLFAMHGVSGHGASGMAGDAEAVAMSAAHSGVAAARMPAPADGHGTGLTGLCLAVLAALLVIVYAGRLLRVAPGLSPALSHHGTTWVPRVRDPVSPDRTALCVQRC